MGDYEYYCAFRAGDRKPEPFISYGDWKIFKVEQVEKVKRMTDEEVKDLCGVNPGLVINDDELTESIKDWGKQTYAKDEEFKPFTLEAIQDMWKAIYKEKKERRDRLNFLQACAENLITENNNKEGRKKLRKFIVRRPLPGEGWEYRKVERSEISHFYYPAKVGSEVMLCGGGSLWRIFKILDKKKKRTQKTKFAEGVVFGEFAMHPINWEVPEYMKELGEKPNIVLCYHKRAGRNTAYEYMKHLKKDKKGNIIDPDPRGKRLYLTECIKIFDENYKLIWKSDSEIANLRKEYSALSEFHKRPYVKVVVEEVKGKPRGKENLEKIKFPCYCSYVNIPGQRELGQINKGRNYELYHVGEQGEMNYVDGSFQTLKGLMTMYNVEILKGELKLWREVGKKGESKKKEQ